MDPLDRMRDLLSRINDLSDQELGELRDLVLEQINTVDDDTGDGADDAPPVPDDSTLAVMQELADATTSVNDEIVRRNSAYATRDALAAAKTGMAELSTTTTTTTTDGTDAAPAAVDGTEAPAGDEATAGAALAAEETTETPDGATAEATDEDATTTEGGEPVTAGGTIPPATQAIQPPADRRPVAAITPTQVVTASADVPGFTMGQTLGDSLELGKAMCSRIDTLRNSRSRAADGEQVIVASVSLSGVPTDRHLVPDAGEANYRKVMDVIRPKAIVAAGGMPTPVDIRYELFGGGVTDRPVQAALPSFTADRGGIQFMTPPTLAQLAGAVGIWDIATDEDAALPDDPDATPAFVSPTKPVLRVNAGAMVTVNTQAVTLGLVFGNMTARTYPELVARHTDLAMQAHARIAEQQLLAQIGALSLKVKSKTQVVGAARTVLATLDKALAGYRNRYRTGAVPVRIILPAWFKDLLRADLVLQMPGDGFDTWSLADSLINQWFSARGVNITWALDGESGQDFAAQANGTTGTPVDLTAFPTHVIGYLFAEGTFLYLDGGTLDLGIVRDSTLNSKNDYQTFVETFEAVAKVGYEGLRIDMPVQISGAAAALVATSPGVVA